MTDFRVQLDIFRGPMDLMLYLVRKHELDISELQLGKIADQYQEFIDVIKEIDINACGDFLEVASKLVEMKASALLPKLIETSTDSESAWKDPRENLVERLLEYKQYRDVASVLNDRNQLWTERYQRLNNDLPPRKVAPEDQPIHEVSLWDLVSAVGRVLRKHNPPTQQEFIYDDTPIHVYVEQIQQRILRQKKMNFTDAFQPGMHKSSIIGIFLAVLELVRHHAVVAEQEGYFGDITIRTSENFSAQLDPDKIDSYGALKVGSAKESVDPANMVEKNL